MRGSGSSPDAGGTIRLWQRAERQGVERVTTNDTGGPLRTVLVTGGSGFLGAHLVAALHARGDRVRVLDREPPPEAAAPDEWIAGSIDDRAPVERAVRDTEQVYHLAALAQLWVPDKGAYERINHDGTRTLLAAAEHAGVSTVVHCATAAVLTHPRADGVTADDDARPEPRHMPGPYCRAKLLGERAAFAAARSGRRVIVVNPTVPIGPGDRRLSPPARMLLGFLNGEHPAYLETLLNLVDARDVAAAMVRAAEHGRPGRRYVLGGTNIALSALLAELETRTGQRMPRRRVPYWLAWTAAALGELAADRVTGRAPTAPLTGVRLARAGVRYDNARARNELGARFRPLGESLDDAIADFRARGLLYRDAHAA